MKTLGIDIETFSSIDLTKTGVYKYVEAPDFEILLFGYSIDGAPVKLVDLACGEELPQEILEALTDPRVLKTAHNANFERVCIAKHFNIRQDPDQWECTMVKVAMLGYPLSLDQASKAMNLSVEKDNAGKALIRFFTVPCKPTKTNGERFRNLPKHAPEKWQAFRNYCIRDVQVEQEIRNKVKFFELPEAEKKLWSLDQKINDRGILLDPVLINNAIRFDIITKEKMTAEAVELTGLSNPNSATQLKRWLTEEMDEEVTDLKKDNIPTLLESADSSTVKRVLELRQEMAKTSIKKYLAMHKAIGDDKRVRGLFQFYGANRTGRWGGRLIQPQNLRKNDLKDLDLARRLTRSNDLEILELCFGNVPDTLSQLIRTAFIADQGKKLIVSDFSAIEARVIAWLAGEKWKLDVFNTHGKIYEAAGAQMFKVPIESVTKGSKLRDKAKIAELALGYQGGPAALIKMGALRMGLEESELQPLVNLWRNANRKIVEFWYAIETAAITAVDDPGQLVKHNNISFCVERDYLFITLPSGRRLAYIKPRLKPGKFGNDALTYEGTDQNTKQWKRLDTYGGKLVENIVQATARDLLREAMLKVDAANYNIVMHVHDEIVLEEIDNPGNKYLKDICAIMSENPVWATGLPLGAEGYVTDYYKKD
jgi:DNA polymerase